MYRSSCGLGWWPLSQRPSLWCISMFSVPFQYLIYCEAAWVNTHNRMPSSALCFSLIWKPMQMFKCPKGPVNTLILFLWLGTVKCAILSIVNLLEVLYRVADQVKKLKGIVHQKKIFHHNLLALMFQSVSVLCGTWKKDTLKH